MFENSRATQTTRQKWGEMPLLLIWYKEQTGIDRGWRSVKCCWPTMCVVGRKNCCKPCPG